ncbi:circularly permutated Ras protein 1-like isoform X2 [Physella acuta]|uniref:circularly permutated Ras protein 1-like isoform X2 n=1 Tax=Physella acuta TaxID=109671 RepID=UPI0027DD5874|nr:circularly permutated Ras protein 1-like isoform X2 [Physella acuta]
MDFGSEFVLVGDDGEEVVEEVEEEVEEAPRPFQYTYNPGYEIHNAETSGFECEIMEFDDEEELTFPKSKEQAPKKVISKQKKAVNTNTVCLKMTALTESPEETQLLNNAIRCDNALCEAVFSHIDQVDDDKTWCCKFCGFKNQWLENVVVKTQDVLYVDNLGQELNLEPLTDYAIIFVIDTSGSMGRTAKVTRPSQILQDIVKKELEEYHRQMRLILGEDVPQAAQSTNEVSWLQLLKAAIISKIQELKTNDPQRRVGLITFSDKVMVYKDGMSDPVPLEGGQLVDYAELLRMGHLSEDLRPIFDSADSLIEKIKSLKEEGQTSLGPALVAAEGMVRHCKGSKVILCTDGVANIGIGKLEDSTDHEINKFYDNVTKNGKVWGLSLSIVSFDDCKLQKLGKVADETGGIVERVKPTELDLPLKTELSRQTIATGAEIKFVVHKSMYIKGKEGGMQESNYTYHIGNIMLDKSIPFSFASRSSTAAAAPPVETRPVAAPPSGAVNLHDIPSSSTSSSDTPIYSGFSQGQPNKFGTIFERQVTSAVGSTSQNVAEREEQKQPTPSTSENINPPQPTSNIETNEVGYPFQVQINFIDKNGVKALRVWTRIKPFTSDRSAAVANMNWSTMVLNFIQENAKKLNSFIEPSLNMTKLKTEAKTLSNTTEDFLKKNEVKQDINLYRKLEEFSALLRDVTCSDIKPKEETIAQLIKLQSRRDVG